MTNKQYWQRRIDNIYDANYNVSAIKKAYKQVYRDIKVDLLDLYNTVRNKELSRTETYKIGKYQRLAKKIEAKVDINKTVLSDRIFNILSKAYKQSAYTAYELLGTKEYDLLNDNMVKSVLQTKWLGGNYRTRFTDNMDEFADSLKSDILNSVVTGKSKDEVVKKIMNTTNTEFYKADRLVRSELQHTINQGQLNTYKDAGVQQVEWIAEEDDRCCDECAELNGTIYSINNPPTLIIHPNCRCTILPVI